jgi:hypothetical protein
MSTEPAHPNNNPPSVLRGVPAWIGIAGGLLLAVSYVKDSPTVGAIGGLLFSVGAILFFAGVVRQRRMEGVGLMTAVRRGVRDAVRFVWYLMP